MSKLVFVVFATLAISGWWLWTVWGSGTDSERMATPAPVTSTSAFPAPVERTGSSATDRVRVREAYVAFLFDESALNRWTTFSDAQGVVPLPQFLAAVDARVEQSILSLVNHGLWQMYRCPFPEGSVKRGSDLVFSLRFSLLPPDLQSTLQFQRNRGFSVWEPSMVVDVAPLVFPSTYYNATPIPTGVFENIDDESQVALREIGLVWPDGATGVLGYVVAGDELLIGSSRDCLLKAQELLFDTRS